MYARSTFVFGVEYAPARVADAIETAMRGHANKDYRVITMREVKDGAGWRSGVLKTQQSTRDMVKLMKSMLQLQRVRFSDEYMCVYPDQKTDKEKNMIQGLIDQMEVYQFKFNKTGDAGKFTGKIGGANDDLIVSTMMLPYWSMEFLDQLSRGTINAKYGLH